MRKKLLFNLGLLLAIFAVTTGLVIWYLNGVRAKQEMLSFFHLQINSFAELFYLSTIVQQQQFEIHTANPDEINPLVDNILQIDRVLTKTAKDLKDPEVTKNCISCHAKINNSRWPELAPQIASLQQALNTYKYQVSELITNSVSDPNVNLDMRMVKSSRKIVAISGQAQKAFDKMEIHLISQNRLWVYQMRNFLIAAFLVSFLSAVYLISRLVRQVVGPITQLESATKALTTGEYPERIDIRSTDEMGALANAFNQMVEVLRRVTRERENLLVEARNFNAMLEQKIRETRAELKAAEEHLVRSETLSAMGTLAAGVSHEISNPIHVIMGICSLALKDADPDSSMAGDLKMIEMEAGRCQKIVNGLLDFARKQDFEKSPTSLNLLAEDSLDLIKHQVWFKNIAIVRELQPDLPENLMDPNRIKQVIVNLLINAGQAMPGGGTLTVKSLLHREGEKSFVQLKVADTGVGISKEIQKKIFDPFFTTKKGKEGTGLGLAISHRIIEEHGGSITVRSELGKGAEFTILLPLISNTGRPANGKTGTEND